MYAKRLDDLETKVAALEKQAHEPFDFTHLIARLDGAERTIEALLQDVEYLRNASRRD